VGRGPRERFLLPILGPLAIAPIIERYPRPESSVEEALIDM
jgi:hypothetical protein